ncbi:MAG: suppressor of fused domain protein [Cardiobacteriaceae bacterium]|nr:suppressor of fused domain protein [Cardiobacteriaceae bacterium]
MSLWKKIMQALGVAAADNSTVNENLADDVIRAREAAYAQHFGALPADILKMANLVGRWPGGGIYKIASTGNDGRPRWVYVSSGLANPGIPALAGENSVTHDGEGRVAGIHAHLQGDGSFLPANGFGYEILVIAEEDAEWPLMLLQWAINAEFSHRLSLLEQVEQYQGVSVGDVATGDGGDADLLIHKAQAPLPASLHLPNGEIPLLVITTITKPELDWSLQHGRDALLQQLLASPVGQTSFLSRESVLEGDGEIRPE